jgi:hypothetical protein
MKTIALILVVGMGLMGLSKFANSASFSTSQVEDTCASQCCSDQEEDNSDTKDNSNKDCAAGCDCSNGVQLVAIEYLFSAGMGVTPQRALYGFYTNDYHFRYSAHFFQPPRFS